MHTSINRRKFFKSSATLAAGFTASGLLGTTACAHDLWDEKSQFMIGPMEGFSPHIGTLVSMLNYNRQTIINTVQKLTMAETDFLFDASSNTIGALVMHLGATEKFYQVNTFEGRQEFNKDEKRDWEASMTLGDMGRKAIKGQEVKYYLDRIAAVREKTLAEFKKKDDAWLLAVDPQWSKGRDALNTYWKWFHVCEHESNHRGQITWLKGRLPGAKAGSD
jgi:uncharacterized damage-inducible protein DinB